MIFGICASGPQASHSHSSASEVTTSWRYTNMLVIILLLL